MEETITYPSTPKSSPGEQAGERAASTRRTSRILLLVLASIALVAALVFWRRTHPGTAAHKETALSSDKVFVETATVTAGNVTESLDALGTVTPMSTVNVYSLASGQVVAVHYREGQMVRKGDALVDIDPRPYRAQVEQVQGALDRDRASLHQTQIDLARYREAYTEHAVAKQILDDQEQTLAQYAGAVRNDEGQVAYAQVQLSYCRVVAPTSGRVGLRLVDPGNTVFSGGATPLVTIASVTPMTVVFSVPEDRLAEVRSKMARTPALKTLALDRDARATRAVGRLRALDNEIDTATGTLRLRAEFGNEGLQLYPNQFVTVRLELDTLRGIAMVPSVALQRNGMQAFVYVVQNGKVTMRNVAELATSAQQTGVRGVQPGEQVVLTSFDRLQPGASVRVGAAAQEATR